MPTRSGLSYSGSSTRMSHSGTVGEASKKVVSRKTSVDMRESQSVAGFVEHDYSRSSSNRTVDKNNKNKRLSSLKLKGNSISKSKISEAERKLIAKEKEKLEKSKKILEQQKNMDRIKFKRKEEALKTKQKELERKEREAKKKEQDLEKTREKLQREMKRLKEKASKESDDSERTSAKRKLRSSSTRESLDSKRVCNEESKQAAIDEIFESELTCSVCSEYFIQAVNLNCSHTFCLSCIEEWKHSKQGSHVCPICREKISNQNRELILDNLIDQLVVKTKPHLKEHRIKLAEERKKRLEKKITQNQNNSTNRGRLSRLIPSLHFFLRQTNVRDLMESDTDDVDVIGLDFGDNFLSSSSSVSSASSSELESVSEDSSDNSSDDDDDNDSVASIHSSVSSVNSQLSGGPPDIAGSPSSHTSNSDNNSDSDESLMSLPSNRSNHMGSPRMQVTSFDNSDWSSVSSWSD